MRSFFHIHFTKQICTGFFFFFLHINGIGSIHSTWKQSKAHSADPHGFKPFQSELMHSVLTSTLKPVHYVYTQKYDERTTEKDIFPPLSCILYFIDQVFVY